MASTGKIDAVAQMLNHLDEGKCVAVVAFSDAWDKQRIADQHCNKMAVDNLFGIANGMPVRDELAESLTYVISVAASSQSTPYAQFELDYRRKFLPPMTTCQVDEEEGGVSENGMMTTQHLLGPVAVSLVATAIAMLLFMLCPATHSQFEHVNGIADDKMLYDLLKNKKLTSNSALIRRAEESFLKAKHVRTPSRPKYTRQRPHAGKCTPRHKPVSLSNHD